MGYYRQKTKNKFDEKSTKGVDEESKKNVDEKSTSKRGRPTKFDDLFLTRALMMARFGFTDKEIAEKLGVGYRTFQRYKAEKEDFWRVLKECTSDVDLVLESCLCQKAHGYMIDEITHCDKNGTKIVRKHIQPDTTALIFWLKNRQPATWRDVKSVHVNDVTERPINIVVEEITNEGVKKGTIDGQQIKA